MKANLALGLVAMSTIASCGSSAPAGTADAAGSTVAVTITTGTCMTTETDTGFDLGSVVTMGTATGPTGSRFTFEISNAGEGAADDVMIDCGTWTQDGTLPNNVACVAAAGNPTISWTVTQTVYWCTSQCDSSPAPNNADLTVKYTTAAIVDENNANPKMTTLGVACPLS